MGEYDHIEVVRTSPQTIVATHFKFRNADGELAMTKHFEFFNEEWVAIANAVLAVAKEQPA